MEQNFQTSFIPKRPIIEERAAPSRPISLFTIVAIFLLLTVLIFSGGLYIYKGILNKNLEKMKNDLNLAKNRFEPTKIAQLQTLDKRLDASTEILSKHISISPIFEELQKVTMKTIRFTKFGYTLETDKALKVRVKMSGQAVGYRSIALQSDLLNKVKYFMDPVFSNLSLDDKGNVLFDLEFLVDPVFVNYNELLKREGDTSLYLPENLPEVQN